MNISNGAIVEMRYRLLDAEGALIEATEEGEPVTYRHGDGEILPGLEKALEGAEAGGSLRITVEPEDAYGDYNPDGLVIVPRSEMPEGEAYTAGDWLSVHVEDDGSGLPEEEREMEMRVVEVNDEQVVLDANHPLAGQRVIFEVDVLSVQNG